MKQFPVLDSLYLDIYFSSFSQNKLKPNKNNE